MTRIRAVESAYVKYALRMVEAISAMRADRKRGYLFFFSSRRRHTRFDCDWSFRRVLFRSLKLRKEMQSELKALQHTVGITFIYVTHDQEEAITLSNRIAVMNAGQLEQEGTPTEV